MSFCIHIHYQGNCRGCDASAVVRQARQLRFDVYADAGDNLTLTIECEPAGVRTICERGRQRRCRRGQEFVCEFAVGYLSHVAKHLDPMARNDRGVPNGGAADGETQ